VTFYKGGQAKHNFVTSFASDPKDDLGIFARGYFQAARTLADHLMSKPGFADYEAYPIVFLYRHSMELFLKGIIYRAAVLSEWEGIEDIESCLRNTHRLVPICRECLKALRKLFHDDEGLMSVLPEIQDIACELETIDQHSFSYRYPIDRNGRASTENHQVVNLGLLSNSMNRALDTLDTIHFGINMEIGTREEMEEFFREVVDILSAE
jgi:hypothetical protein